MRYQNSLWLWVAMLALACTGEVQISADAPSPGVDTSAPQAEEPPRFSGTIPDAAACEDVALDPGPQLVRRLTNYELINTVEDVLGVNIEDVASLLVDDIRAADGFSNAAQGLFVSLGHVEGWERVGRAISDRLALDTVTERFAPCTEFTSECIDPTIASLGLTLFRTPLAAEEIAPFRGLFDVVADEDDPFEVAVGLLVEAMVQSPQFLYRLEIQTADDGPEIRQTNDFEMATRLSYLVWQSAPDEQLLQAAQAGELRTPEQIQGQVERMLGTERARQAML